MNAKHIEDIADKIVSSKDPCHIVYSKRVDSLISHLRRHRGLIIYTDDDTSTCSIRENYTTLKDCKVFGFVVYVGYEWRCRNVEYAIDDVIRHTLQNNSTKVVLLTSCWDYYWKYAKHGECIGLPRLIDSSKPRRAE